MSRKDIDIRNDMIVRLLIEKDELARELADCQTGAAQLEMDNARLSKRNQILEDANSVRLARKLDG